MESEVCRLRDDLLQAQNALNRQTRRCRELVEEFTRKLQENDLQYEVEKKLREDQLAKLLRALLLVEARLKQEQKLIINQLKEKDTIITKQENDIKKLLLASNYCKNCNTQNFESLESSSLELDSSSEYYYSETSEKPHFQKNIHADSRKLKKHHPHRKSIGTYFEVLKIRNESPFSNEDNTSNDYDNFDSLPPESVTEENDFSESNITVIKNEGHVVEEEEEKPMETMPVFEVEEETNDKWYVNGSDHEENQEKNTYHNNPVLECVNQILINTNSPPETPESERKKLTNKRVKFELDLTNHEEKGGGGSKSNYYETPIQKTPNHYESPQSIYSNDYEPILTKKTPTPEKKIPPRIPPALPPKPSKLLSKFKLQNGDNLTSNNNNNNNNSDNISLDSEPTYCSISELNLPQTPPKKIQVIATIENEGMVKIEKSTACVVKIAKQTPLISEEIPKLPLVSEIIIPEDDEKKLNATTTQDNYIKNNTQQQQQHRRSINIGTSVSSLIMGFNNRDMLEINNKKLKSATPPKKIDNNVQQINDNVVNEFNLNQNFEEFKLDECEIEEYENEKGRNDNVVAPPVVVEHKQNDVAAFRRNSPNYEHFLECTGLSSKSILSHPSTRVLKPRDVKFRSKNRNSNVSETKYWSEPFI